MNRRSVLRRLCPLTVAAILPQYGGCVTTNQLKDFFRTEIALVTTQILSAPINEAFLDLAGPQVIEEIVPSI